MYFQVIADGYRVLGGERPRFSVDQYGAAILALANSEGVKPVEIRNDPRMVALIAGVRKAEEIAEQQSEASVSRMLHSLLLAEISRQQFPGEDFMAAMKRCCDADVALHWAWETSVSF